MKPSHLHILQHSLGLDEYGRGRFYRNHYVCDPEPDLIELCAAGLMVDYGLHGLTGGMHCYAVTDAGKSAIKEHSPKPPKASRSAQRWQRYLNAKEAFGCTFKQWIKSKYYS